MNESLWFLPPEHTKNIKWKKRKKVPQWYIDLLNGKKVKFILDAKDWRHTFGRYEKVE